MFNRPARETFAFNAQAMPLLLSYNQFEGLHRP